MSGEIIRHPASVLMPSGKEVLDRQAEDNDLGICKKGLFVLPSTPLLTRGHATVRRARLVLFIAIGSLAGWVFAQAGMSTARHSVARQAPPGRTVLPAGSFGLAPAEDWSGVLMGEGSGEMVPVELPLPVGEVFNSVQSVGKPDRCGSVVYANTGPISALYIGANQLIGDDCRMVGTGRAVCQLTSTVYNGGDPNGSATRPISLELWDDCPQGGGILLAASPVFDVPTSFSTVTWNLSPSVPVGNTVWVAWSSTEDQVGPAISGQAELGHTADRFGWSYGGIVSCNWVFLSSQPPYAGFDVTISAEIVPSACCLPDDTCLDLSQGDCEAAGGTWYVGAYCERGFVCPPRLPPDALYGQSVFVPTEVWNARTSDVAGGHLAFDRFTGADVPICDVHFWGVQGYWNKTWGNCPVPEDPMQFAITFYEDDDNLPGAAVCTYAVTLCGTDTGLVYQQGTASWHLYEYGTSLQPACTLADGWVSIQGAGDIQPSCWFLWMNGHGAGDGAYWQYDDTMHSVLDDFAFCLTGASLALTPTAACYSVGSEVSVSLRMSDMAELIRGGQFFLSYDNSRLTFVSAEPGDGPFTREIYESVVPSEGTVDYAVGIPDGYSGTATATVMARFNFVAAAEVCRAADLIAFRTHAPPTRLSGDQGNEVVPLTPGLPTITIDGTAPVVGAVEVTGGNLGIDCKRSVTFSATVTDGCCLDAGDVTVTVVLTAGDAMLEEPSIEIDQVDVTTVAISGSVTVSAVQSCPATVQVTVGAKDCCGRFAVAGVGSAEVTDSSPPEVACNNDVFDVNSAAGVCAAPITWNAASAVDNCSGDLSGAVVYEIDLDYVGCPGVDAQQATTSYLFPPGSHLVTARAMDACGNTGSCSFIVTVSADNEIEVNVQLQGVFTGTRCITFELWSSCPHAVPADAIVDEMMTFANGSTGPVMLHVPCGDYVCITARDKLHTLRRTDESFHIDGWQYVAQFAGDPAAGGDWLIGGNLNNDYWVDILDFGLFLSEWIVDYGAVSTTCATASPHADISGNGSVFTEDFTFIQINTNKCHEANCCGASGLRGEEGGEGPVVSITTSELERRGLGRLVVADVNGDGVLDQADMAAFLLGMPVRPH